MWIRRTAIVFAVVAAAVSLGAAPAWAGGGCLHGVPPSDGTGDTVEMNANCFEATVLHVDPGAEVTWLNRDPYTHTVTGVGGTWGDFSEIAQGGSVSYRFDTSGVYVYSCIIHPGMVGAVVVGDGSGNAGLDPAAVATLPADPPAAATAPATSDGSSWIWSSLLAGLIGIGLGLAFARKRRSQPAVVEAGV